MCGWRRKKRGKLLTDLEKGCNALGGVAVKMRRKIRHQMRGREREGDSLGAVGGRCPIDDRDSRGVAAGCISYQGNYGMMEVWNHKSNTLS